MRPSQRQRERAVRTLSEGCADGRLSTSTLERRVEHALVARSVDELRQLTVDIDRVARLKLRLAESLRRRAAGDERPGRCLRLDAIGSRPFVVGRSPDADLVIRDERVSRRHAQILRTDDGYLLTDLGSTNGTWIAGRRVGQIEVAAGDVVELADVPLRLA